MARLAVVTGGTRGIGAAIAQLLKDEGFGVVASYRGNVDAAERFERTTGIRSKQWDAANFSECARAVAEIHSEIGPIDVLVNNAGITRDTTLHRMSEQQWDDVININLKSCFNMCRAVIDSMRERNYGRIISISSINGQRGQYGQVNYCAAKAGIIGFTKALAYEGAAKGITANVVAPGYVDTDMVAAVPEEVLKKIVAQIPVGRLGTALDIARAVLYLAREESSFITGSTISINGGHYMLG